MSGARFALAIGLCLFVAAVSRGAEPITVGSRLELLADDYPIDKLAGDARLAGKPVRLRITVRDADLFAFRFR